MGSAGAWVVDAYSPSFARLAGDLDWMARANCQGQMALFFSDRPSDREQAKALCLRCSVLAECAGWRDRVRPKHGVWAGAGAGTGAKARRKREAAEKLSAYRLCMEDLKALTDDELLDAMAEEYPTYEATIQFAAQGLNATEGQEQPQASPR